MTRTPLRISLTENAVFSWPKGLEGWRMFRVEWWDWDHLYAARESHIWLPRQVDPEAVEEILERDLKEQQSCQQKKNFA